MSKQERTIEAYDHYSSGLFAVEDDVLAATRAASEAAGLRPIQVSANSGQLLRVLALAIGARRVLEIGTLGGYSAIWLARALPEDGQLITLEIDERSAAVARTNLARAGLAGKVEVRIGPALASLAAMQAAGEAPFDLVFIDADKESYPAYLALAAALARTGGLILADNTLPDDVLEDTPQSGASRYNAAAAAHPGLASTVVPVLRRQGFDGLTISIKLADGHVGA